METGDSIYCKALNKKGFLIKDYVMKYNFSKQEYLPCYDMCITTIYLSNGMIPKTYFKKDLISCKILLTENIKTNSF